jgi:PEP-CTERM motif
MDITPIVQHIATLRLMAYSPRTVAPLSGTQKHWPGVHPFLGGTMKLKFAATAAALIFAAGQANAANIIVNGDFESGNLSPWYNARDFSSGTPWDVGAAFAHTGKYGAGDIGNKEIRQDFAGVATSDIVSATFWLRHPTANGMPAYVSFFYSDNTDTGFVVNTANTDWQQFDVLSRLATGKTLTGFAVFGYVGPGVPNSTYLDDVAFLTRGGTGVPEPAAWALMLAGFGMVGFAMRRREGVSAVA